MPRLSRKEDHQCPLCAYKSRRDNLKVHLTKPNKDGTLKCYGLKVLIPPNIWSGQIVGYYSKDAPLPDLKTYIKSNKSPGRKKTKVLGELPNKYCKERLVREGIIDSEGQSQYTKDQVFEILRGFCDSDDLDNLGI